MTKDSTKVAQWVTNEDHSQIKDDSKASDHWITLSYTNSPTRAVACKMLLMFEFLCPRAGLVMY